jgi:hypothetical protein
MGTPEDKIDPFPGKTIPTIDPLKEADPIAFCLDPSNWNELLLGNIGITDGFQTYVEQEGVVYLKFLAPILILKKIAGIP